MHTPKCAQTPAVACSAAPFTCYFILPGRVNRSYFCFLTGQCFIEPLQGSPSHHTKHLMSTPPLYLPPPIPHPPTLPPPPPPPPTCMLPDQRPSHVGWGKRGKVPRYRTRLPRDVAAAHARGDRLPPLTLPVELHRRQRARPALLLASPRLYQAAGTAARVFARRPSPMLGSRETRGAGSGNFKFWA